MPSRFMESHLAKSAFGILKKVREIVRVAHDAVRKVAVALAQIPRVNEVEDAAIESSGSTGAGTQQ